MRRNLCQLWNVTPAELAQMDARQVYHESQLIWQYEAELAAKAQREAASGRR